MPGARAQPFKKLKCYQFFYYALIYLIDII